MKKNIVLKDDDGNALLPITDSKNIIGGISYIDPADAVEVSIRADALPHNIQE